MKSTSGPPTFDAVARELASSILHFLERYVGSHAVAEELLQETLLRMNKGLPSFAGRSSVKTWAFSIASHVAADHLRQSAKKANVVALDTVEEPADPEPAIEERMIVGEMNECIRGVIDSLPGPFRAALILHDLEGLSAEQTAEICECSVATAKIRIHRARDRLKQSLAKQCDFYHGADSVLRCDAKP